MTSDRGGGKSRKREKGRGFKEKGGSSYRGSFISQHIRERGYRGERRIDLRGDSYDFRKKEAEETFLRKVRKKALA